MQSEVQLAEANSKEKLLPLDQYLKDCWAKKQTAIDLTAYKITHEELNKVIFGIHYEEPEYYWTIRNDITDTDPQTGLLKTYYPARQEVLLTVRKNWNGNGKWLKR